MTPTPPPSPDPQQLPDNPFVLAASALIGAIEECHSRNIDEGIKKDIWVTGIESLRIIAVTQTLSSLSDNKKYPDTTLRGTLTAMLTRAIDKTRRQIDKLDTLIKVTLE